MMEITHLTITYSFLFLSVYISTVIYEFCLFTEVNAKNEMNVVSEPVSDLQSKLEPAKAPSFSEVPKVLSRTTNVEATNLSNGDGPKVRKLTDIHLYPLKSCGAFKVRAEQGKNKSHYLKHFKVQIKGTLFFCVVLFFITVEG